MFQKDTVFPWRTVERNIALGLEYRGTARRRARGAGQEAIALAGLQGFEEAFPATLSGACASASPCMRSLVADPEILLMDEPFGALDTHTKLTLHAELLALWEAKRQTVVFVTHDLSEAITLADRVVVMTRRPGRIKLRLRRRAPAPPRRDPHPRDRRVLPRVRRDLARARESRACEVQPKASRADMLPERSEGRGAAEGEPSGYVMRPERSERASRSRRRAERIRNASERSEASP